MARQAKLIRAWETWLKPETSHRQIPSARVIDRSAAPYQLMMIFKWLTFPVVPQRSRINIVGLMPGTEHGIRQTLSPSLIYSPRAAYSRWLSVDVLTHHAQS